ncbi:MAG: hypothetical protein DWQ04_15565 [Chloroflexi bacterium]|nr:MAG: hypothetical protein DWQ04_15565 [Chloroflexota bacterium]
MKYKLPTRAKKTYLELVRIKIYNHSLFHKTIPEEAAISYPLPASNQSDGLVWFFHYWIKQIPKPHILQLSKVLTQVHSNDLEAVKIIKAEMPSSDSAEFPQIIVPETVGLNFPPPLSRQEKRLKEVELYLSCQAIMNGEVGSEKWQIYSSALAQLTISNLLPIYHTLNNQMIG